MRHFYMRLTALVCLWGWACFGADAQLTFGSLSSRHTHATLILSAETVRPGDTVLAGVDLKMDAGWHTYWKNPGAAGQATEIKWHLPPGISAGDVQWPLPEKFPPIEVTTYGYHDEVVLIVPLKIGTNIQAGPIDLKATVSWLECMEACVPGSEDVEMVLNVAGETKPSTNAAIIETWQKKVPQPTTVFSFQAWWEKSATNDFRPLLLAGSQMAADIVPVDTVDFFPDASDAFEIGAFTENLPANNGFEIRKKVQKFSGDWPKEISGVFVIQGNNQRVGYAVKLPVAEKASVAVAALKGGGNPSDTGSGAGLPLMLVYAFIGGLILNIMPCVLPVIALKILGFVSEARSEPRRVRNLGLIYAAGVLASFLVLAAIVVGLKAAGHHAGWGMQFGNPVFVVCLTTLVMLVALNLFSVYEIVPGGKILNAAGQLAARHGAAGAFFNGLLATILATPCTAPFLGSALGFAFAQSAAVIVLIFLSVGAGLAAPYVLLSCNPGLLKFLPKPGPWMEKFKIAMGFPMLATVVWLLSVAASDYGARVFWLGIFLVIVALAAWIFGEFAQRGRGRRGIALAVVLALLAAGYIFALERNLRWREMIPETGAAGLPAKSSDGIAWQAWSPQAVAAARAAGKPVLVDFTAAWCVTCNAVVRPALESDSVSTKLKEIGAVTLLADYTRTPPAITDEISKYGVAGVPLVLVFPKNPDAPAIVLPQPSPLQLPSGYSKIILSALERANQ